MKGDYDDGELPEKKVVQIGEFKIGMIHGHQVLPWGDIDALTNVQRELGCDILLSGHTHQISIQAKDKKFYINPGSISGSFSHLIADPSPSFVLMVLQGEEARVFLYILNDKSENFELTTLEFIKGEIIIKKLRKKKMMKRKKKSRMKKKKKKWKIKKKRKMKKIRKKKLRKNRIKMKLKMSKIINKFKNYFNYK